MDSGRACNGPNNMTSPLFTSHVIHSRNDPRIKRIRALHSRQERDRTGRYYAEGIRFVSQAVRYNAPIETLVVCPSLLVHPYARKLARQQMQVGTPVLEVTQEVLHSIALVDEPQGIGAVLRQKWLPLERVRLGGKLCWVALDALRSPGNLGSVLRTSDAVGGAGLILLDDATDPYDPATIRASMGALFSQRFVRTNLPQFSRWKEHRNWHLVGTSPSAPADYHAVSYPSPAILLLGEERQGLSQDLQAMCDLVVRIPMVGRADSLNVAVAGGVMLYEMFNQMREIRKQKTEIRNQKQI
jgi:RNA methyltransferase, TrmH family